MRITHKAFDIAQNNLDVEVMFPGFWVGGMNLVRATFFQLHHAWARCKRSLSAESMFLCKNNNTKTQYIPRYVTRKDLHAK